MKSFLLALAFCGMVAAITGLAFRYVERTATEAYSSDSARPEGSSVGTRGGWRPDA